MRMATLTTYAQVEAELAATASYDVNNSVSEAQRRAAALRRKLDFAEQSDEEGRKIRFNHEIVQSQLRDAVAYVRDQQIQTDAEKLKNPVVVHADFSTFGQYGGPRPQ